MLSIRTVLCPVDLSPASPRHVDIAASLCHAFGARLVLHHNLIEFGIGSGVGWMWAPGHPDAERRAQEQLAELITRVPSGTHAEIRLTHGPLLDTMLSLAQSVSADLIVMSTRGGTASTDGSVTERVLKRATLPVLAIHEQWNERRTPRFNTETSEPQALLVPTDLTATSRPAMQVAFDLARRFPFTLHLLHVLPGGSNDEATAQARERLLALVPGDVPQPELHLETGIPADVIARVSDRISASCIVMGERERHSMRHWFRPDTSLGVLHPSACPVWYVPEFGLHALARLSEAAVRSNDESAPDAERSSSDDVRLVEELRDTGFHYWPASHVYGIVDSLDEAERALADLLIAGVPRRALHTWHGPVGKDVLDPSGVNHGRAAQIWRRLEKVMPERDLLDRYGDEVEHGHVCIGVRCGSRDSRDLVAGVLGRHGGHLISYFSLGAVEHLTA
ncbi:MAG: universal stress protein [Vicinamibacterales bacterium]